MKDVKNRIITLLAIAVVGLYVWQQYAFQKSADHYNKIITELMIEHNDLVSELQKCKKQQKTKETK